MRFINVLKFLKLIKINLNQTVSKAQLDYINEEKQRWMLFGGICALFAIYLIWFGFINVGKFF